MNSLRVWPSLKIKTTIAYKKYRKKGIPDLWDSIFTPKLPALPCLALQLGWHPACPAKHPEAQGSAGIDSSEAPTISVVCSTQRKKSGGGDLHGDVCASLHSFRKGEQESQQSSTAAAETGGEVGRVAQPPWGQEQAQCELISFPLQAGKVRWHLAVFRGEARDEMG